MARALRGSSGNPNRSNCQWSREGEGLVGWVDSWSPPTLSSFTPILYSRRKAASAETLKSLVVFNSLTRDKTWKSPLHNLEVSTNTSFQEFPEKKLSISINLNNATNKSLRIKVLTKRWAWMIAMLYLSRRYEVENFSEVLAKDQYSWGLQ